MENSNIGCVHYKRKCRFISPCCKKSYTCRLCHDEAEDHRISRTEVRLIQCLICLEKQSVQVICQFCGIQFGKYTCLKCRLFDDEDKRQFHCDQCGICRVGGEENCFHCTKCNFCLRNYFNHKCVENCSHTDCPVCLEDIHSSREQIDVPKCGHLIHKKCLEDLKKSEFSICPQCKASLN